MNDKVKHDVIMLGFGHGYLSYAEKIVTGIKELRQEINSTNGFDFPQIHIVDHDYDSEKNKIWLDQNEFVIRIFGIEKARFHCDGIQPDIVVQELKKVILDNITEINQADKSC